MSILGYATITDFDKFAENYIEKAKYWLSKGNNFWLTEKINDTCDKGMYKTMSSLADQQFMRSNLRYSEENEDKITDRHIQHTIDKIKKIYTYVTMFGQKLNVYYQLRDMYIVGFGKTMFLCYENEFLHIEKLKDYSDYTPAMFKRHIGETSATSLVPSNLDNISQKDLDNTMSAKKKHLDELQKDMEDVKEAKSGELKAMQDEIDRKIAEMNVKKEELMAKLNEKKAEMEAQMQIIKNQMFMLNTEIYGIRCFLGETVNFTKLHSGKQTDGDYPVVLFQKIRYLDEELGKMCSLYNFDFDNIDLFETFLTSSNDVLDTFCPSKKCISLVKISRDGTTYAPHQKYENMLDAYETYHGKTIGIIIRDDENVYVGWTDDEMISVSEDMFYKPEVKTYTNKEDAENIRATTKEEIASRYFIFNILQGVLENTKMLILNGFHSFVKPDDKIIYSCADNWLVDNRFGTFEEMYEKYSKEVHSKVGDAIISTIALNPNRHSTSTYVRHNDRGIGYADRTHDVYVANNTIYDINHIEDNVSYHYFFKYIDNPFGGEDRLFYISQNSEQSEEWIKKYEKDNENITFDHMKIHHEYQYYVSLFKDIRWDRDKSDYKRLPKANFEVYKDEFINLSFFNSEWMKYVISNKCIGDVRIAGTKINYAYLIPYLKTMNEHLMKREEEEAKLIGQYCDLSKYPNWLHELSLWKYENDVHKIGIRAAKKFAQHLTK